MNRRKSDSRTPAFVFFALIAAAVLSAGGGVIHVYYKNRQIKVARDIDAIERRIEQYSLDTRTTRMRMDQLLNRFAMRQQLQENSSALCSIPVGLVEKIENTPVNRPPVAAVP